MALRKPSTALQTTLEENDREISMLKARVENNDKACSDLTKTIKELIEQTKQKIQAVPQPAPLLAPAPVPLPVPVPAQPLAPAPVKNRAFKHRLGDMNGEGYANEQDQFPQNYNYDDYLCEVKNS
jgi:hypothetical protein